MTTRMSGCPEQLLRRDGGFTLIEGLLSSVILAVAVMAVSAGFYSGFQTVRDEGRALECVNYAAGKMDELMATDFANIVSGSDNVTVQGETVARDWVVELYDVDMDLVPDDDAKRIVVTVGDVEFSTLIVDSAGRVTYKR